MIITYIYYVFSILKKIIMIIHLAPNNQLVKYCIIDIYRYPRLKSYDNRFPLQACGNDADGVIPEGNAGIQLFRTVRYL